MKTSFFESVRYVTSQKIPSEWPLPPGFYEPDVGGQAFRSAIERLALVIDLFFQSSAADDPQRVMHALERFGKEVLPRIREI
jgi:hypothetical protein